MKLILKLELIPEGRTVRKVTGEKPYKVKDKIAIFGGVPNVITAEKGCRFLVAEDGSVHAIPSTADVAYWGDTEELHEFLSDLMDDEDSK